MMNWWWTDLVCQRLPQTITDYHRLSQTTTDYHRLPQTTTDCHWLIGCTPLNTQTYLRDGPSILLHISLTPPTTRAPLAVLKKEDQVTQIGGWGGLGDLSNAERKRIFSADVCPISGSNLIFVFGYIRPFLCQILMRIQLQSLRGSLSDLSLLLWHQRCPNIQVLKIQHPISSGSFEEEEEKRCHRCM